MNKATVQGLMQPPFKCKLCITYYQILDTVCFYTNNSKRKVSACQVKKKKCFILNRQGSWKTGEKESGSSEEEKKLEEKVEENSQKAEV